MDKLPTIKCTEQHLKESKLDLKIESNLSVEFSRNRNDLFPGFVDSIFTDWSQAIKSAFLQPPDRIFKIEKMETTRIGSKMAILY